MLVLVPLCRARPVRFSMPDDDHFQSPSSLTETGAARTQVLEGLFQLVTLVPTLTVEIRRLYDVDRRGRLLLL
jgi:hypothetical protein